MPRVPYDPVASVAPSSAGTPGFSVQANPGDFGAQIGQSLGELGSAITAHDVDAQERENIASAQAGAVDVTNQYRQILRDPKTGYLTTQGKAAVDAYPAVMKQLSDVRDQAEAGLPNDAARRLFNGETIRILNNELDGAALHASQQQLAYQKQISDAFVSTKLNAIADSYSDPGAVDANIRDGVSEIQSYGKTVGAPDGETALKADSFTSTARRAVVERMAVSDPIAAQDYRRAHLGDFTAADNLALDGQLKGEVGTRTAIEAVNQAVSGTASPTIGLQNNIANLRASDNAWLGKGAPVDGFETFASPELGARAAATNILTHAAQAGGSISLADMISGWAPATDKNNVPAYIASVSQDTGLKPTDPVPTGDPVALAGVLKAMNKVEKGTALFGDATYLAGAQSAIDKTALPVPAVQPHAADLAQNLPQLLAQVRSATSSLTPEMQLATERELIARVQQQHEVEGLTNEGQAKSMVSLVTGATAGQDPDKALVNQTALVTQLLAGHDDALKIAVAQLEARHAQAKTVQQATISAAHQALMGAALPSDGSRPADAVALLQNPAVKQAYADASPEGRLGFLALVKQNAEGSSPPLNDAALGTYYRLKGQAASDPSGFASVNLMDPSIVGVLPRNLALDLMNDQARGQTADAREASKTQNLAHALDLVKPLASAAGLNVNPQKNTPDEQTLYQLTGRLSEALSQFQDQNKKLPNDDQVRSIGRSLLIGGFQKGTAGWFGLGGDKPAYPFQVQNPADFYPDIPAEARAGLSAALAKKFGRPPTDREIQGYYMQGKAAGLVQ